MPSTKKKVKKGTEIKTLDSKGAKEKSDVQFSRVKEEEKKLGSSGKSIKFVSSNPFQTEKGILSFIDKDKYEIVDRNKSRFTNSRYITLKDDNGNNIDYENNNDKSVSISLYMK